VVDEVIAVSDHNPAGARGPGPASADAARARLVDGLRATGRVLSPAVRAAFEVVPRHVFVPEMGQSDAYRDEAFVLKCGPDGIPLSSSSQPAMMAIMLEQLELRPGQRVLEIGTGSGYNAALMSVIAGPDGRVVTVDIDADLVTRARASLAEAGFAAVDARCADGGYGDPPGAPFDRIIVTAGAWDIAPAWLDQLAPGGRLVLPLSVRGIELSVALERDGPRWLSTSACRCGFVRMLGDFARPQRAFRLGGADPALVQVADGSPVDAGALAAALAGPAVDLTAGLRVTDQGELGDLDLWLAITEPGLDRLIVLSAATLPRAQLLPLGGLASDASVPSRAGVAAVLPGEQGPGPGRTGPAGAQVMIRGYGPGGEALAARLADRARDWARAGRPGTADVQLRVWPGGQPAPASAGMLTLDRPSARIEVGWPPPAR
jgi:protein-L-isoaspartate(D-aspartate) O-methyltransferase